MIGLVVDEVAAQKERMTLGERQTETKTFGEVVDFDKRLVNKLLSLVGQAWTHILNNEENMDVVLSIMGSLSLHSDREYQSANLETP